MSGGFLDEQAGAFPMPKGVERELPALDKVKKDEKHQAKAPCKSWQLNDIRAGWNTKGDQMCFNIVAKGLSKEYDHPGETEMWLRADKVGIQGDVQRKIANSLARLVVGVGVSQPSDWTGEMSGKDILNTLMNVVNAGKVEGFFNASLVFSRRAYQNNDGNIVRVDECNFQFIDNGRKTA